jgi:hypothetical protein
MTMNSSEAFVFRYQAMRHAELSELLGRLVAGNAWCIVTRIDDRDFCDFDPTKAASFVEAWSQGRVFCVAFELRWRRLPAANTNDVFILCEDDKLKPQGFEMIDGDWRAIAPSATASLAAWGSPPDAASPNLRAESRLPDILRYPISCRQGALKCLYYQSPSGVVQFIRLTEVI